MARMDRFMVSDEWDIHFGGPIQILFSKPTSDHFPVLLEGGGVITRGSMPFRLENMWPKVDDFTNIVRNCW